MLCLISELTKSYTRESHTGETVQRPLTVLPDHAFVKRLHRLPDEIELECGTKKYSIKANKGIMK